MAAMDTGKGHQNQTLIHIQCANFPLFEIKTTIYLIYTCTVQTARTNSIYLFESRKVVRIIFTPAVPRRLFLV